MDGLFLVHLSDLHLGASMQPLRLQELAASIPWALYDIGYRGEEFFLVVSGDITQCGGADQFALAHSFLRSRLHFGRLSADSAGLRLTNESIACVPGNHDQWGGFDWTLTRPSFPAAFDPRILGRHFRPTPWVKEWQSETSKVKLQLFGLDSNSGLNGTNARARGVISTRQFEEWETLLAELNAHNRSTPVIRAAVLHHNVFSAADWGRRVLDRVANPAWPLDDTSRERLLQICAREDISLLFTGHAHSFEAHEQRYDRLVDNSTSRIVRELRCSTTLKSYPLEFLIHRARIAGNRKQWQYWRFIWSEKKGRYSHSTLAPDGQFLL